MSSLPRIMVLKMINNLTFTVKSHSMEGRDWEKFSEALTTRKDGVYSIVIRECTDKTSRQLGYYWAKLIPLLANMTGYSKDKMHEVMKVKLLQSQIVEFAGDKYQIVPRLSKMNKAETSRYIDDVVEFMEDKELITDEEREQL